MFLEKKIYAIIFFILMVYIFIFSSIRIIKNRSISVIKSADNMEKTLQTVFPHASVIREMYGVANLFISRNEISNENRVYIRNSDGMIQSLSSVDFDTYGAAEGISYLGDYCKKRDIKFAYISFPSKYESIDYESVYGIKTNYNKLRSDYIAELNELGINVLNIRQIMENAGFKRENIFYKTDHHWNTFSAFYAAGKISEYLKNDLRIDDVNPKMLSFELFNSNYYPNCWFGETGRLVSLTWTGLLDDFVVIKPKYATSFHYYVPGQYDVEGDFSILVNEKILNKNFNLYTTSLHYAYLPKYGNLTVLENKNNSKGAKILLIRDSFSNSLSPFLILSCGEIDIWDMRGNNQSVLKYIEDNDFDVVLVAYTDYWNEEMYHFK